MCALEVINLSADIAIENKDPRAFSSNFWCDKLSREASPRLLALRKGTVLEAVSKIDQSPQYRAQDCCQSSNP